MSSQARYVSMMIEGGKYSVIGVDVNAVDYEAAVEYVIRSAQEGLGFGVSALAVHGVMTGATDPVHRRRLNELELVTPDGQPVRWALNWLHGQHLKDRVYGPTLTLKVCERAADLGIPVFFYGSRPEVLELLAVNLRDRFPGLIIAGSEPSKFRPLEPEEKDELVGMITGSGAQIAFIGLGCPRQETFVHEFKSRLPMPLLAVGAAFDFHAGLLPQAPGWMQRLGLEWLFRLIQEPRRLWKRYLFLNPYYLFLLVLQRTGLKRFEADVPPEKAGQEGVPPRVNVLGVGVSATNMDEAVAFLKEAARTRRRGYVCVTGVHGVIESQRDVELRRIHNQSLLTVPDGMPTVWTGLGQGFGRMRRVYGPDLMMRLCRETASRYSHFFCGASPEILDKLTTNLKRECPGLHVAGTYAPPFRDLNDEELRQLQEQVGAGKPDFFWVGMSTPKQERFMAEFIEQLDLTVMIGSGAAFDIHAGLKKDAPEWVKRAGLQWFHRLCQEPARLWRRYLVIVPSFLWLMLLQVLGIRKRRIEVTPASNSM